VHRTVLFNNLLLCKKPTEFSKLALRSGAMFSTNHFLSIVRVNVLLILFVFYTKAFSVKKISPPRNMRVISPVSPKIDQITYFPLENEQVNYLPPGEK
jgi:hypothetical protein